MECRVLRIVVAAGTAAALFSFPPRPLAGQDPDLGTSPGAQGAAQVIRAARQAQVDFENLRRRNFPPNTTWGRGRCDALVGRMCWRYQPTLDRRLRDEAPAVTEARDALLQSLGDAGRLAPGDEWLLGQRVRYLVEADRLEEARTLAWQCGGASIWWCRALEALVLHLQGRFPEAERAFDEALQNMDTDQARKWEDPTPLLEGDVRSFLRDAAEADPGSRGALEERLWQLGDPLYLVPGNDLRTEHMARHTLAELFSDAAVPHRLGWGSDMAELLLRYGPELSWERILPRPGEMAGGVTVVGFESPDLRTFFPPKELLSNPAVQLEEPWVPRMWTSARSGYAPTYAPVFLPMASRLLVFTRGDRALVAATFQLPTDTTYRTREGLRGFHVSPPAFQGWPLRAGLVLDEVDEAPIHATMRDGEAEGVLMLEVPAGAYQASVEALDPVLGVAGRYRNGLVVPRVPPDLPVLSGLLLIQGDSLPATTQEALTRLRIVNRMVAGEPLLVGWELWGLGWRRETVQYRLTLEPADPGLLSRFRRLFGGQSRYPILEWEEPSPDEPGAAFQSVSLTPPGLDPGDYRLRLEVSLQGRNTLVSEVVVRVAEAGGGQEGPGP